MSLKKPKRKIRYADFAALHPDREKIKQEILEGLHNGTIPLNGRVIMNEIFKRRINDPKAYEEICMIRLGKLYKLWKYTKKLREEQEGDGYGL